MNKYKIMEMNQAFVEGWEILSILGEGSFGEVKLIVNSNTGEAVAAKFIDTRKEGALVENIKKEVFIHRRLRHEHIIRYYGHREEDFMHYIFLEYAPGGELYDRLEPDVGMPLTKARKYFCQLLKGVEYLHSLGIAHRDLKPENILLDQNDNVKISDFGLATIFRFKGKERVLSKRCGTIPYIAPEVYFRRYCAEPADIWSCGIILCVMLCGELPWQQATSECSEYVSWKSSDFSKSPWTKMDSITLGLLVKVLCSSPSRRYTIAQIFNHLWCKKFLSPRAMGHSRWSGTIASKRLSSDQGQSSILRGEPDTKMSFSQPVQNLNDSEIADNPADFNDITVGVSFSQPVDPENMILASQFTASQMVSKTSLPIGTRLTRFCIKLDLEDVYKALENAFEKLGYCWKKHSNRHITVTTQDRRNMQLIFKVNLLPMNDTILVDFRRSRGDGIEFKRYFLNIKEVLSDIIDKQPMIGIATN